MPLVIVLHPHGSSAEGIEKTSGMSLKADKVDFAVVYPEGTGNPRAWKAGFYPLNPTSSDDVAFVSALMDKLEKDLPVDDKRIYICGFSNGAFMTYRLGAELSERIAAIAVVEGTIGAKEPNSSILIIPNPSRPIPLIAFHGKEDHAVPYNGGDGIDGIDFLSVVDSIRFWVRLDGCNITPKTMTSQNGNIVETDYTGGIGGSEVVLITIGNGKHDWPSTILPDQISATDSIWELATLWRSPPEMLAGLKSIRCSRPTDIRSSKARALLRSRGISLRTMGISTFFKTEILPIRSKV